MSVPPVQPSQAPPASTVIKKVQEMPQFGMWVGFLHIIYFIALYAWATSFGDVLHQVINRYVPNPLETEEARRALGYFTSDYIIRWALASLIIFYPIFVMAHLFIARLMVVRPEIVNIRVRKILIYTTLIGTFLVSAYQLVRILYSFLDGSISMRTFAHFGLTTSIAFMIFIFYFFQIRKDGMNV